MKPQLLEELFERALAEEIGLVIECNNPHQMSLKAHAFAKNVSRYEPINICVPTIPDTIMLVKRTVSLHNVEAPSNEHQHL